MLAKFKRLSLQVLSLAAITFACPIPAYSQDITTGLVGHWNFDEASGSTALDQTGNANGTLYNTTDAVNRIDGQHGGAVTFTGTADHMSAPPNGPIQNIKNTITIAFWLKLEELNDWGNIINKMDWNNAGFAIEKSGATDNIYMRVDTDGGALYQGSSLIPFPPGNKWHHIAFVTTTTEIRAYKNGELIGTVSYDKGSDGVGFSNNMYLTMGSSSIGEIDKIALDELRIYNRALTDADIYALANYFPGPMACNSAYEAVMIFNTEKKVMQYCNGTEWINAGPPPPPSPTNCPTIGDECSDGSYYIGDSPEDGTKVYMTSSVYETSGSWDENPPCQRCGNGSVTGITDGRANVEALRAYGGGNATAGNLDGFRAAKYCDNLTDVHGHSDWYLPAGGTGASELGLFWAMVQAKGTIDGIGGDNNHYWSSTEDETHYAHRQRFNNGSQGRYDKTTSNKIRCVRRAPVVNSTACTAPEADAGSMFYNSIEGVLQYCNGLEWVAMGPQESESGAQTVNLSPIMPTAGLIGHWPLDTNGQDTIHSSHGVATNGGYYVSSNPKYGSGSFALDGFNDTFVIPTTSELNLSGATEMTVSLWVDLDNVNVTDTFDTLFMWEDRNEGDGNEIFRIDAQEVSGTTWRPSMTVFTTGSGSLINSVSTINLNYNSGYHQIVGTYDGANIRLYVDGELAASTPHSGVLRTPQDGALNVNYMIGSGEVTRQRYADGHIDDVRLYNRALDENEVKALYKSNSLLAHWKLDETSGTTAADSSGNGYTGTLSGSMTGASSTAAGASGNSMSFNGINDVINLGNNFNYPREMTVCGWAKPQGTGDGYLWGKYDASTSSGRFIRLYNSGTAWMIGTASGTDIIIPNSVDSNTWQHICAVFRPSGQSSILYKNGSVIGSSTSLTFPSPNSVIATIGNRYDNNRAFNGLIDDVRIYNRALTTDEISSLYTGAPVTLTANCSGLGQAHYNDAETGHCYYLSSANNVEWAPAKAACEADGAYLASITTQEEQDLLSTMWVDPMNLIAWIGGTDTTTEGEWIWTGGAESGRQFWSGDQSGSAVNGAFTAWGNNQPGGGTGENCAQMRGHTAFVGEWNDERCDADRSYICEKSPQDNLGSCNNPDGKGGTLVYNNDHNIMQYCNGEVWIAMGETGTATVITAAPTGCDTIGQQCDDDSFYIGLSPEDGERVYMTSAAFEGSGIRWDSASCSYCGDGSLATSQTDGRANTNALLAFNATGFNAAAYCDGLEAHGYNDWYLPAGGPNGSSSEINLIWEMVDDVGVIGGLTASSSGWYWSSSENSSNYANVQRFSDGTQVTYLTKSFAHLVRCVRRAAGAAPVADTTDPVWTTAAGTVATIDTGAALSTTVVATDDSGSVTYSKASGDAWISVNATTGELTGTAPGSATTASITVTATDPSGNTATRTFDVVVEAAATGNGTQQGYVVAGADHSCALREDGTVACWGRDHYGQATPPSGTFKMLSAGASFTCGIRPDDTIDCWGSSTYISQIPSSGAFKFITSSSGATCAIRSDDTAACWGASFDNSPRLSPPTGTFIHLSIDQYHSCGVRSDNSVACWGLDYNGQVSNAPSSGSYTSLSGGGYSDCALATDETVLCWGEDSSGQSSPPSENFVQISATLNTVCGITTDGTISCWGSSSNNVDVPPSGTFKEISGGNNHFCAIRSDDTVACWGLDNYGQSTPPAGTFGP